MKKENKRLNITLRIPDTFKSKLYELSKEFDDYDDLSYRLDDNHCIHMTLYVTSFLNDSLDEINIRLAEVANKFTPIRLTRSRFYTRHGYLAIEFNLTKEIKQLHEKIVSTLTNLKSKDTARLKMKSNEYSKQDFELLKRYGSRNVFSRYQPHISLAKFTGQAEAKKGLFKFLNTTSTDFCLDGTGEGIQVLDSKSGCCEEIKYINFRGLN